MSRHRHVRNLTEEDYYDDYDDDDDDYYDDEQGDDDETAQQYSYYSAQQQQSSLHFASRAQGQQTPSYSSSSSAAPTPPPLQQQPPLLLQEQLRLLEGMGFTDTEACQQALQQCHGDAQRAVEVLLSLKTTSKTGDSSSKNTTTTTTSIGGGVTKPPPGLAAPPGFRSPKKQQQQQQQQILEEGGESPQQSSSSSSSSRMVATTSVDRRTPETKKVAFQTSSTVATPTATRTPPPKPKPPLPTTTPSKSTTTPTKQQQQQSPSKFKPKPLPPHIQQAFQNRRSRLSLVVMGHVDAGKSTLMGQVLLQLGYVHARTVQKYRREAPAAKKSFALAWVLDEDDDERRRGVTMDVACKHLQTPRHDIVILDAPGHADFCPEMIRGAAAADAGVLVVAAAVGEFEAGFLLPQNSTSGGGGGGTTTSSSNNKSGGQTREHILLARGLGVSQLIVAVNKLDAVGWSRERFEEIQKKLRPFLLKTGFAPGRVRFVPCSGLLGTNVKEKPSKDEMLASWYKGPTLLEAMDGFVPAVRHVEKPFRAILTDVYAESKGVTCKCRVVQGVVQVGDALVVLPLGDACVLSRVEHGLFSSQLDADGDHTSWAMAGDSVDLHLSGVDLARVSPGCVVSHPTFRPAVQDLVRAKILVMDQLAVPVIQGAQVLWHMHSLDVPAVVTKLLRTVKRDGSVLKEKPRVLVGGASAVVEIRLKEKVCLETYADCRALGRFVLRRGGDTIALGMIEQVLL